MSESNQSIGNWLMVCVFLIATMVVVGGLTRLTNSGLSITEWGLVMGTIPPLNEQAWIEAFDKYKETPEYRIENSGMSMADFKTIFWWEYLHRLLGRVIGFAVLLPLCWFAFRKQLNGRQLLKLSGLFVLGGLQGFLGWYMVQSGLVDMPHVSHYRLTAHLTLAFLLFGATLWLALDFYRGEAKSQPRDKSRRQLYNLALAVLGVIFLQVALGGMVAGLRAGYLLNTFPKMGAWWIPPGLWNTALENPVTMQFFHRLIAYAVLILIGWVIWKARKTNCDARQRNAVLWLTIAGTGQFVLGIATLLLAVPIALGSLHQLGALILFGCSISLCHALKTPAAG